ncbi:hypothetical protein WDU94_006706 [Cyamophila willieti]
MNLAHSSDTFDINELSPEQQKMLIEIRRRKAELLLEIQTQEVSGAPLAGNYGGRANGSLSATVHGVYMTFAGK